MGSGTHAVDVCTLWIGTYPAGHAFGLLIVLGGSLISSGFLRHPNLGLVPPPFEWHCSIFFPSQTPISTKHDPGAHAHPHSNLFPTLMNEPDET